MVTSDEALHRLRDLLSQEEGLRWAYVFGSLARGERFRDVDLAIMPIRDAYTDLLALGRLQNRLANALERDVDVVDLRTAPLPLLGSLLVDRCVLVDRDPEERRTWEADSALRWLDFKPVYERASALRREALRARRARAGDG